MSTASPAKVGVLIDYLDRTGGYDENVMRSLELVADEFVEQGLVERPVEFVVRAVQGLPNGTFRAVRDAFGELVDEGVLVIFGPWVSENAVALAPYVERAAEVVAITMAASETLLGEWFFGLPAGSMEEEPIIMATIAHLDGCRTVGIASEDSLIGAEYLRTTRTACKEAGLRITAEVPIPQVEAEKQQAMEALAADRPDAILHVGFGLGIPGMNAALEAIGWMPPRYTTTAFEFAATSDWWRQQLAGWIGLDQFDERNEVARGFLDRFEARHGYRPEYFFPPYCYDVGRMMLLAIAGAKPLTGAGVKDALEKIKMLPAASGAPGTRLRFGRYIRHGWMGTEFLVARRVLPDGSRSVLHGTINGLVEPPPGP
jgi:ABC-type branched-subunit amino acid transport system substrate-binding protein